MNTNSSILASVNEGPALWTNSVTIFVKSDFTFKDCKVHSCAHYIQDCAVFLKERTQDITF